MSRSRGNMSIHHLFHAEEIGVSKEPNLDRLVKVFMQISEGIAARWIQMPKGMLLLVMVPDNPASGAIYIYDLVGQQFSLVSFEGADDTLTVQEFESLLSEYRLMDYVSRAVSRLDPAACNGLKSSRFPAVVHFESTRPSQPRLRMASCGHGKEAYKSR